MNSGRGRHAQHISQQYNIELDEMRNHLLLMGGLVQKHVGLAIEAAINGDSGLAQQVLDGDRQVNAMEVSIDEECSGILARRQPAASDLRLVMAVSKVNTDLERVGDEAGKIARQAISLSEEGGVRFGAAQVRDIGERVGEMLNLSLDAFARLDTGLALRVARQDSAVDRDYEVAMREMVALMTHDPARVPAGLNVLWVLRALERIGDHAGNIAEYVIYLVEGRDVRHLGLKAMEEQLE